MITNKLSEFVKEQQAYERERDREHNMRCGQSWIQAIRRGIMLNDVAHSGLAVHICGSMPHGSSEACRCKCGATALVAR